MQVLARFVAVVAILGLVSGAALAGASIEVEKRQINMGSAPLYNDGTRTRAIDYQPGNGKGGVYDPNRTFGAKGAPETAAEMQDLYKGLEKLRDCVNKGTDRTSAWSGASANTRRALASMGIDSSNWAGAVKSVVVLPRRVDNIKAVDHARGGETSLRYETQNRPTTESYVDSEPVWGPIGCGCQGWQVVGYRQVVRTRVVSRPTLVAVASKTPVVNTSEILTPYDGTKPVSTTRQVAENYTVSVAVTAPIGCGCQGQQVVGYRQETLTRMTTVVDVTYVQITAFEHHLPQKFAGKGNGALDTKDNAFLAEGSYKDVGNNMVERPTNDAGSVLTPSMPAFDKQREMAGRSGNDDKPGVVINPNGRTAAPRHY